MLGARVHFHLGLTLLPSVSLVFGANSTIQLPVTMSGFEVAGVVLGGIPLIISGLENWRKIANAGHYFRRFREEYKKWHDAVRMYELIFKGNLKILLLPIVGDADEVSWLVSNPNSARWKSESLALRLQDRLQEFYPSYVAIIISMKEEIEELYQALSPDKIACQTEPCSPEQSPLQQNASFLPSARAQWDYQALRLKFSVNESERAKALSNLKEHNERLEKLLSISDKITALQQAAAGPSTVSTSSLERIFAAARKTWQLFFEALQKAWQCSCRHQHVANIRLEHRTLPEICFEIILLFANPSSKQAQTSNQWSFKQLQCGRMPDCPASQTSASLVDSPRVLQISHKANQSLHTVIALFTPQKARKVTFRETGVSIAMTGMNICSPGGANPCLKLCQRLGSQDSSPCMGIIGHENERYHLHPSAMRRTSAHRGVWTLRQALSGEFRGRLGRRQRYKIALLLASTVAQLQFTEWLRTNLTKDEIFFFSYDDDDGEIPYHEPYIRRGFSPPPSAREDKEYALKSLGILLLELCFGSPLEDQPQRQKFPSRAGDLERAFDQLAAREWLEDGADEGGEDYASAIKWCLDEKLTTDSWPGDFIRYVIRPLEACQEHFIAADAKLMRRG
jgi:hypothetical protein